MPFSIVGHSPYNPRGMQRNTYTDESVENQKPSIFSAISVNKSNLVASGEQDSIVLPSVDSRLPETAKKVHTIDLGKGTGMSTESYRGPHNGTEMKPSFD